MPCTPDAIVSTRLAPISSPRSNPSSSSALIPTVSHLSLSIYGTPSPDPVGARNTEFSGTTDHDMSHSSVDISTTTHDSMTKLVKAKRRMLCLGGREAFCARQLIVSRKI